MKNSVLLAFVLVFFVSCKGQNQTFAERLGYNKGDRVIILHVDDAGMSYDSNEGTKKAIKDGASTSCSVMMPCPWAPGFINWLKENQDVDAGLHLTLNSEWDNYRWGPVAGKSAVPTLCDDMGYLWPSTGQAIQNGNPEEVKIEIRAQLQKAREMGFEPSHIDAHMGTIFAREDFMNHFVALGMENHIPVMFPCGHNTYFKNFLREQGKFRLMAMGQYQEGMDIPLPMTDEQSAQMGELLWGAGLPVIDDMHNQSYDWPYPEDMEMTDENILEYRKNKYKEVVKNAKPGVTMIIMHCTEPTAAFADITESIHVRKGDFLVMTDPDFQQFLKDEGVILTTFKDLMVRRNQAK
ncbi:polysaccharide deacetylase family protein [bacterium SCSIO 12741]|nr:polysaccharide deacetylase family protein [bacterium SCSIO 12741]